MKLKRLLSALLCAALVFSFLPSIALAGSETAEAGYTLTYNLTTNALSSRVTAGTTAEALAGDILREGKIAYQLRMFDWRYKSSTVATGDTGEVPYATLDLTKTAPYAIENTNRKLIGVLGNNDFVDNSYLSGLFITSKYGNESSDRPHVALRLKIDKAGTYDVAISASKIENHNAYAEIWFGKAPATYTASGIDAAISSDDFDNIGWWNNKEGCFATDVTASDKESKKLDALTVTVPEAGEYWIIFNINEKSLELNQTTTTVSNQDCQYLRISAVTLTAVEAPYDTSSPKTAPTIYTYEMRENAIANAKKYAWAQSEAKAAKAKADKYVDKLDGYYNAIVGEGIPRSAYVGLYGDYNYTICRYCGSDIMVEYGRSAYDIWNVDVVLKPWKVECPACKRMFPTNDFASFYKLGLKEDGTFDRELALEKHKELFDGTYGVGYLKNDLYRELENISTVINCGEGLRSSESVETWGVDDGFGYNTGVTVGNTDEVHTYIPHYVFKSWEKIETALNDLSKAYVYTGA